MNPSDLTPEIQARMLSLLLRKEIDAATGKPLPPSSQRGVMLFKHFKKVDAEAFASTFSTPGMGAIIGVLGEYYSKYDDLPSKEVYAAVKEGNLKYQRWFNDAKDRDRRQIKDLEISLFDHHPDDAFLQDQLVGFVTRSFIMQTAKQTADFLINAAKTPMELAKWSEETYRQFLSGLEEDLGGGGKGLALIGGAHKVSESKDVEALVTMFKSVRLYLQGISVLVAPPKSFKTGLSQNISLDLAVTRNADVLFIDLENGSMKMMRRWWQKLLNCPKEWFYADAYIDVEMVTDHTGIPFFDTGKRYSKGDRVFKCDVATEESEDGTVWTVNPTAWQALKDGAETVDEWEEINLEIPDGAVTTAQDALEERLANLAETTDGEVMLESMRQATVEQIAHKVRRYKEKGGKFFNGERPRVLVIDWGQKLRNPNPKLSHWEKKRDNYTQLQALCELEDLHLLIIEAPKDYAKLSDPHFQPKNLVTAGTDQIAYDAVSMAVVMATDAEREAGYRRIQIVVDRDSDIEVDYVKVNYGTFSATPVDEDEHRQALPELWQEWETGPRPEKKGKREFKDRVDDWGKVPAFRMKGSATYSEDVDDD